MRVKLPVPAVIADLEQQIEHCVQKEAHHAEQESFHREQRAVFAADLVTLRERLEAFRAAAEAAGELVGRHVAPPAPEEPKPVELPLTSRGRVRRGDVVEMVVREKSPEETFGPSQIAREIQARFGAKLRKPIDARAVSTKLRRLAAEGLVRTVRQGVPHHEALYRRA